MVQEFVHVRRRRNPDLRRASREAVFVSGLCQLHAFEEDDLSLALDLLATYERLDGQDAVFAATALNRDVGAILTSDRVFDDVLGLERIDPADEERVGELTR